jgi:hypothetical protein
MNIQPFIFNWRGQYNKTCKIESDLKKIFDNIVVINSDDDNKKEEWVNIGESAYFAHQFLKAIELFDGDIFFHIQGDITFDKWEELVRDGIKYFNEFKWGIYAPNVDYTWYNSQNADVNTLQFKEYKNLKVVSNPDCTVWMIHKDIIGIIKNALPQLSHLKYGWGLDLLLCANSFLQKRLVIRDYNYTVEHPQGTGYAAQEAYSEMQGLIQNCDQNLQITINTIRFYKDELAFYFGG